MLRVKLEVNVHLFVQAVLKSVVILTQTTSFSLTLLAVLLPSNSQFIPKSNLEVFKVVSYVDGSLYLKNTSCKTRGN